MAPGIRATRSSSATRGSTALRRPRLVSRSSPIEPGRKTSTAGRSHRSSTSPTWPSCPPGFRLDAPDGPDVELFGEPEHGTGAPRPPAPLADRMRPRSLDEIVGQEHLLGPGRVLRAAIETGELHSMILWGPPGSGKTTLASLMASVTGARFVAFSAVLSGVKEIREVIGEAERAERARGGRGADAGRRRAAAGHRGVDPRGRAAADAPVRQVGRGALQPDFSPP